METLTIEILKAMKPGVFAQGETIDAPGHCNMAGTGKKIRWVASRGQIHDWTIYVQNPHYVDTKDPMAISCGYVGVWSYEKILHEGDKVGSEEHIKKLVPCTDEALKMYRF